MKLKRKQGFLKNADAARSPAAPFIVALMSAAFLNGLAQLDARVYAVPMATLGAFALFVMAVAVWKCALALGAAFSSPNALLTAIRQGGAQDMILDAPTNKPYNVRRRVKAVQLSRLSNGAEARRRAARRH